MAKKRFVPSSDKEIASVYIQNNLNELMKSLADEDEDSDIYETLKEIAGKNLREARLNKIINRIIERLEKLLAPVDKYLDTKK